MLGAMSITHWMIVICIAFLLFGGKHKISDLMSDVGKGFKELKNGMRDSHEVEAELRKPIDKV